MFMIQGWIVLDVAGAVWERTGRRRQWDHKITRAQSRWWWWWGWLRRRSCGDSGLCFLEFAQVLPQLVYCFALLIKLAALIEAAC